MKFLGIPLICFLVLFVFHLRRENTLLQKEISCLEGALLAANEVASFRKSKYDGFLGEARLDTSATVREAYRIHANYGDMLFTFRIEERRDQSVFMTVKRFSFQNPLTKAGKDTLYSSITKRIDASGLAGFKERLSTLRFFDLTLENDKFCCFGGGSITLETIQADGSRYKYSTFCRQAKGFAEACEAMMRLSENAEIQRILRGQGEGSRE